MATAIKASPAPVNGVRACVRCLAIYRQDFQRCPLDGESLVVSPDDPWIGCAVGNHYVIERLVGEGAMGRVYRARHKDIPDRHYAIKIMIGDYAATAQMRARFQLEAENASKLAHPNVVGVVDYGKTEHGVNYLVMDLVEGPSLGAIVQRGPMDPDRVIKISRQLCEGLDHAHSRGMIHRDFKPDNILVVGDGDLEVVRIADFGLSLSMHHEVRLTTTGIVCTPAYAAPEQLRGEAIDHRVDLYALGTSMFEMLSGGILPFNGDLDVSVRTKLAGDAPSVLMVAPNVPPALVSIIGRLLSSDPRRRPRSARAVLRALDGALAAPRTVMRTDETRPLRAPADASTPVAADSHSLPNKEASVSPSQVRADESGDEPAGKPRRPWRFGRTMSTVFAFGITLGGGFAWLQLRGPSVDQAVAGAEHAVDRAQQMVEDMAPALGDPLPMGAFADHAADPVDRVPSLQLPADPQTELVSRAEEPLPIIAPAAAQPAAEPPPGPQRDRTIKPKSKAKAKAHPRAKATTAGPRAQTDAAAANPELIAADFESDTEVTPQKLAYRYGLIGRELRRLDAALGRENTDDLWTAYRLIRINDAVSSPTKRDEVASTLQVIQEAIVDRAN